MQRRTSKITSTLPSDVVDPQQSNRRHRPAAPYPKGIKVRDLPLLDEVRATLTDKELDSEALWVPHLGRYMTTGIRETQSFLAHDAERGDVDTASLLHMAGALRPSHTAAARAFDLMALEEGGDSSNNYTVHSNSIVRRKRRQTRLRENPIHEAQTVETVETNRRLHARALPASIAEPLDARLMDGSVAVLRAKQKLHPASAIGQVTQMAQDPAINHDRIMQSARQSMLDRRSGLTGNSHGLSFDRVDYHEMVGGLRSATGGVLGPKIGSRESMVNMDRDLGVKMHPTYIRGQEYDHMPNIVGGYPGNRAPDHETPHQWTELVVEPDANVPRVEDDPRTLCEQSHRFFNNHNAMTRLEDYATKSSLSLTPIDGMATESSLHHARRQNRATQIGMFSDNHANDIGSQAVELQSRDLEQAQNQWSMSSLRGISNTLAGAGAIHGEQQHASTQFALTEDGLQAMHRDSQLHRARSDHAQLLQDFEIPQDHGKHAVALKHSELHDVTDLAMYAEKRNTMHSNDGIGQNTTLHAIELTNRPLEHTRSGIRERQQSSLMYDDADQSRGAVAAQQQLELHPVSNDPYLAKSMHNRNIHSSVPDPFYTYHEPSTLDLYNEDSIGKDAHRSHRLRDTHAHANNVLRDTHRQRRPDMTEADFRNGEKVEKQWHNNIERTTLIGDVLSGQEFMASAGNTARGHMSQLADMMMS